VGEISTRSRSFSFASLMASSVGSTALPPSTKSPTTLTSLSLIFEFTLYGSSCLGLNGFLPLKILWLFKDFLLQISDIFLIINNPAVFSGQIIIYLMNWQ